MTLRIKPVVLIVALASVPLLSSCSAANASHGACMSEAAAQAAQVTGEAASAYEGDYDLMGLCDELTGYYEGDDGRVAHTLECIREYVEENIDGGVFSEAYAEGKTVPDLMDDGSSVTVCA